jgi:competence protein ComEC
MANKIIFFSIFIFPVVLSTPELSQLIIWNIGQGQWVTYSSLTECDHFDIGGEFWNPLEIRSFCYKKLNRIYISHEDKDHTSFSLKSQSILPKVCLAEGPRTQFKKFTQEIIQKLSKCDYNPLVTKLPDTAQFKTTNDSSHVQVLKNVLIPGDSPTRKEKEWVFKIPHPETIKYLVLGHHGSRTSTSDLLLDHLPNLKLAISSARYVRYGHPHLETVLRLKNHRIPLLKTEDWGNIHLMLRE